MRTFVIALVLLGLVLTLPTLGTLLALSALAELEAATAALPALPQPTVTDKAGTEATANVAATAETTPSAPTTKLTSEAASDSPTLEEALAALRRLLTRHRPLLCIMLFRARVDQLEEGLWALEDAAREKNAASLEAAQRQWLRQLAQVRCALLPTAESVL